MRNTTLRTVTIALALTLAGVPSAFAGAIGGKTYLGGIPSTGLVTERHRRTIKLHAGGLISLRVSRSARTVLVRFTSSHPVIYCNTSKVLHVQTGPAARISGSGSFTASVTERFAPGPGLPPIVQVVRGRFKGRVVEGRIETQAPPCSGVTTFYATAQ